MSSDQAARANRNTLPNTYGAWFGRFSDLREVQKQAIPLILSGEDTLICSPTASGKTEAYAAPAAEIAIAHGRKPGSILILSPTRALANDLHRRLKGPMTRIGLSIGRYTGEHKELKGKKLPCVTISTPESLDSMLARRSTLLTGLRLVVIDEVHVLDNSARGDQLRILLHRLGQRCVVRPQRVAASATVQDPRAVAARYLRDAQVVSVPGGRRLLARVFSGAQAPEIRAHLNFLAEHRLRKVLVFCPSRRCVEELAAACRPTDQCLRPTKYQGQVFAHHGSMQRGQRERSERLFLEAGVGVCFATTTLEMGIDIGSVDYVLIVGVPNSVSSLMQRLGRGGRRGEVTRTGYVARDQEEAFVVEQMLRLGRAGEYCERPYVFRPSVLAQQACVLAGSQTYLVEEDLRKAIDPAVLEGLPSNYLSELLESLVENKLLEKHANKRFVLSPQTEHDYKRGRLHSNIQDEYKIQVVDRASGKVIGNVAETKGSSFSMAGSQRRVVAEQRHRVLTDATTKKGPPKFSSRNAPMVSLAQARKIVEALGVPKNKIGFVQRKGSTELLHGLGSIGQAALRTGLIPGIKIRCKLEVGPYLATLTSVPRGLVQMSEVEKEKLFEGVIRPLKAYVGLGPWAKGMTRSLLREVLYDGGEIDRIAEYVGEGSLVEMRVEGNLWRGGQRGQES